MEKYSYFLVLERNIIRNEQVGDVIRGHWVYSAPFHPTDDSKVFVLNGYAIGKKATREMILKGKIKKITKKEAVSRLLNELR